MNNGNHASHVTTHIPPTEPAQIVIAPEPVEVDAGKTVLFTCVAYGVSTVNIRWDRQDGSTLVNDSRITICDELVTEGDVTFVKSIVEICSFDVADAGDYSCFTWNELGNDTATFDLSVSVEGKVTDIAVRHWYIIHVNSFVEDVRIVISPESTPPHS